MNNSDLPITALCVVTERSKCPPNYTPIFKSYDTATETDLWKDGLFGKKINRFICFTKDYPIAETYNVIEDIKLLNDRETLSGFVPIEKCSDTSEKAFQKKVLCIKVAHRFFTSTAVSDIILLSKTKRAPMGYSYIGNNPGNAGVAPPIPPRPASIYMSNGLDDGFVLVGRQASPPNGRPPLTYPQSQQAAAAAADASAVYNPLSEVPFEINPAYEISNSDDSRNDLAQRINRKLESFNSTLEKMNYDFGLERSCLV